ncbi:MAG: AAA family ATPase [Clostridia bacterium]|nr:AAA family ATPase [Clostridia bacterium]
MASGKYFFSDKQVLNRIFAVYGNTTDCYRSPSRSWLSIEGLLESHLKFMGYKVVLFYGGNELLMSYDAELRANVRKYFPPDAPKAASTPKRTVANPSLGASPAAPKADNYGGIVDPRGASTHKSAKTSDKAEQAEGDKPLIGVKENKIPEYLDRVMHSKVKSCIIFTNCWQLIDKDSESNAKIAGYMSGWYGLPTESDNIALLLFNEPRLSLLNEFLECKSSWAFLYERLFQNREMTDAIIRICEPEADEIRYQLDQAFTIRVTDEMEEAAYTLVRENGGKLQMLRRYLSDRSEKPQEEIRADLLNDYGANSHEDALEKLRTTEGWYEAYKLVKRLVDAKEAQPSDKKETYDNEPLTNMRMMIKKQRAQAPINMSIMLKGNPGTGKTTMTSWIARALQQHGLLKSGRVVKVAKHDLEAGYVGQSAIQTRDKINEAVGGVLFVDEAYSLFRDDKNSGSSSFGRDVIDTFVEQMTSRMGELAFIFAGYPEPMDHFMTANPGLMRRFGDNIVTIPDYQPEVLEGIALKAIASDNDQGAAATRETLAYKSRFEYLIDAQLVYTPDAQCPQSAIPADQALEILRKARRDRRSLAPISLYFDNWYADRDRVNFGNADAALKLAATLKDNARKRTERTSGKIVITRQDFPMGPRDMFACRKPTLEQIHEQFKDVVGMQSVREMLERITSFMQLTILQNKRLAAKTNSLVKKVQPGHYLFVGNPGTGKTMIAEKLALTLSGLGIIERYEPRRVTGLELSNMVAGPNGVDKLNDFIKSCDGGVLVIDEAHQLVEISSHGPIVVKALLDPMINRAETMSFVFCCYPKDEKRFLSCDPGLARRIHEILRFEDYKPDEILKILLMKASKEGYELDEACQQGLLEAIDLLKAQKKAQNGGTAEKLLRQIKISMAVRIQKGIAKSGQAPEEIDDSALYRVLPEDVQNAYQMVNETTPPFDPEVQAY